MKKIILAIFTIVLLNFLSFANLEASVIRGKRYYIKYLKAPCGFKGDKMGQFYTKKEWEQIYKSGKLNAEIQKICPKAPEISTKKLKHLYHFFSSFAKDSGNIPSCN